MKSRVFSPTTALFVATFAVACGTDAGTGNGASNGAGGASSIPESGGTGASPGGGGGASGGGEGGDASGVGGNASSLGGVSSSGGVSGGTSSAGGTSGSSGATGATGGQTGTGGSATNADGGTTRAMGAGDAPVGTPCVSASATVDATKSAAEIQQVLDAQPTGALICFQQGTYRLSTALKPRQGQTLHGESGAVLDGAVVIANFSTTGNAWEATNVTFASGGSEANAEPWCEDTTAHPCSFDEWVFLDGAPLARATSAATVTAGTFFDDYGAHALYVGSNPAGHTVELGTTRAAIQITADDTVIEGLTVEYFASQFNHGAIEATAGTHAVIRNCEAFHNHYAGVATWANGTEIRLSRFHDNGGLGIATSSNSGAIVDHDDLLANNTDGFWRIDGAAGGVKVDLSTGAQITNDVVRGNLNNGIWFDEGADDGKVDGNVIDDNFHNGVMFEVSRGIQISNNLVTKNGLLDMTARGHTTCTGLTCAAGIFVNDGASAEIFGNTVSGNLNGIVIGQSNRTARTASYTIPNVTGTHVHDNVLTLTSGDVGLVYGSGPAGFDLYAASSDNYFHHDTYHLPSLDASVFYWEKSLGNSTRWKGFGLDTDGTFSL